MKTSNKLLFGGLAIVFITSVSLAAITRSKLSTPAVCAELPRTSKTVDLAFDKVSIAQNIHVTLQQGDFNVQIESTRKAMSYINHHVEDGLLKLYLEDNHSSSCPVEVVLTCPTLSRVDAANGSSIEGEENFITPAMDIRAINGSRVSLVLTSTNVSASATNSASIELKGEINNLDISALNSARIQASDVHANTAKVRLTNSASAQVHADTIKSAKLMNNSALDYIGKAILVDVQNQNSSSLRKIEKQDANIIN